jgi:hypothetical protein
MTTNPLLDVNTALRGLAMALDDARAKTAVEPRPENFQLVVNPETWLDWQLKANDLHPALGGALFAREELMGFKIVQDASATPGRLILRCTWEMAIV